MKVEIRRLSVVVIFQVHAWSKSLNYLKFGPVFSPMRDGVDVFLMTTLN